MKHLTRFASLALVLSFGLEAPATLRTCSDVFSTSREDLNIARLSRIESVGARRDGIRSFLRRQADVAAFVKNVKDGELPVILVNEQSRRSLTPLLKHTVGFGFEQRPGYYADHGVLRVGETMIDRDEPGKRNFGELHKNGIAWKSTQAYLPRRNEKSRTIIEIGYLLNDSDMETVELYQRLRRSAIIELPFQFDVKDKVQPPNTIELAVEDCFGFCKAEKLPYMIDNMGERIRDLAGAAPKDILLMPAVARFMRSVDAQLLAADAHDEASLGRGIVEKNPLLPSLLAAIPHLKDPARAIELAHWLSAYHVTERFLALTRKYAITDKAGLDDMDNGRSMFVMIFDNENQAPAFRAANYESVGMSFNWENKNQHQL